MIMNMRNFKFSQNKKVTSFFITCVIIVYIVTHYPFIPKISLPHTLSNRFHTLFKIQENSSNYFPSPNYFLIQYKSCIQSIDPNTYKITL